MNDELLEKIINKLAISTRTPQGIYSAKASYPILEERLFPHQRRRLILRRLIAAAAVIILLCIPAWWLYKSQSAIPTKQELTQASIKTISLPDGTSVTLNRYTTLTYPQKFTKGERKVELNGEAYFEVTKDKRHPFIVVTPSMNVKVMGTHFNVNAYRNNSDVVATLYEGSVAVTCFSQQTVLQPGDMAVYSKRNKLLTRHTGETVSDNIAWRNGEFVFDNLSVEEIAQQLSNAFNVTITIPNEDLQRFRITARFCHGEDLNTILSVLRDAGYFDFDVVQNKITINTTNIISK